MQVVTYRDRPDLWGPLDRIDREVWPEYNLHGDVLNRYWGDLYTVFAEWLLALWDEAAGAVVAEGNTIPIAWDGTVEGLPEGIDAAVEQGFEMAAGGGRPDTLCALAAVVVPRHRRAGLSREVLLAMRGVAAERGMFDLVAPVRPSLKHRYPTIPIEEYARWNRPDGLPFDPWLRVHARLDAPILATTERSLMITGSVSDWEAWTGMEFPVSGVFIFPEGLAPVEIDRQADVGVYAEPNVWVSHRVRPRPSLGGS